MELSHKEIVKLDVVPVEEFQRDPDAYVERVKQERRPIRIREQDGREVVLMSWGYHQELFGELHKVAEVAET